MVQLAFFWLGKSQRAHLRAPYQWRLTSQVQDRSHWLDLSVHIAGQPLLGQSSHDGRGWPRGHLMALRCALALSFSSSNSSFPISYHAWPCRKPLDLNGTTDCIGEARRSGEGAATEREAICCSRPEVR